MLDKVISLSCIYRDGDCITNNKGEIIADINRNLL